MRASAALRASAAPGGVLAGPWVKNELWRRARAVPSLDLPFADYKSLTDLVSGRNLITATRAFSGTFVGSDRLLQSAGVDVPRLTHDPVTGESLGLLPEEQRVNLLLRSEEFDNSPWSSSPNIIITANSAVAPDGLQSADVLDDTTSTSTHQIGQLITLVSGTTYTFSCYFRNVDRQFVTLAASSGANAWAAAKFDIASGAVGATQSSGAGWSATSSRIENKGNNWYRCIFTFVSGSTAPTIRIALATNGTTFTAGERGVEVYTGTNKTLQAWGAQLEEGTHATSYIKTEASTVTRSADVIDIINAAIANNIRTLYLEFRSPAVGTRGVVSLNDNTAYERAAVITSDTDPRLVVHDGNVEQANINGGIVIANARTKVAVRINTNDFSISINGGPVVTDTSGTLPTVDRLMIGRTQAGEYLNAPIARITGWEQLLPDSTLRALAC